MPYDAFISYATESPVYADVIEESLEPRFSCWRDIKGIRAAEGWRAEIETGIEQSTVLVIVVTRCSVNSQEVKNEIAAAKRMNKPYVALVMERYEEISTPLKALELEEKQAIDVAKKGLGKARGELLDFLARYTDEWRSLKPSIDNLAHFSSRVRREAVESLADSRDSRVIPYLQRAFEVEDQPELTHYIFERLGDFDDARVVKMALGIFENPPLVNVLAEEDFVGNAVGILQRWGSHDPEVIESVLSRLDTYSGSTPYCCTILRDSDESVKKRAVDILVARIRITEHAFSPDVIGLRLLDDPEVVEFLNEVLQRPNLYEEDKMNLQRAIEKVSRAPTN